jgi:hypothetical protein
MMPRQRLSRPTRVTRWPYLAASRIMLQDSLLRGVVTWVRPRARVESGGALARRETDSKPAALRTASPPFLRLDLSRNDNS